MMDMNTVKNQLMVTYYLLVEQKYSIDHLVLEHGLTGWQGEVKGANANQGKISLGPTNLILKNHGQKTIPTDAAKRVREEPDKVFAEISKGLKIC